MKKLLLFLLALTLTLTFSACATTQNAGEGNNTNSSTTSSASSDTASSTPTPNYVAPQNGTQSGVVSTTKITREAALDIALAAAGLNKENIRELEIELDTENGITVWEIDFESGNMDYSYDINAATGKIVKSEKDKDN